MVTMPTQLETYLNALPEKKVAKTFLEAEVVVNRARIDYELLINKPEDYKIMFPMDSPEDTLDLKDSFNYIKPLKVKSGQMVWLCMCADAYQSYCCVESVVLSLLFNPALEVPDIARLKQLKERERVAHANPFNAAMFDIEKKEKQERKKAEKLEPAELEAGHDHILRHPPVQCSCHGFAGGRPNAVATAEATQAEAAPADTAQPAVQTEPVLDSVPVIEATPETAAPGPEPVPGPNIGAVLQRQVEPWRLISSRVRTTLGRRPQPKRPPTDRKKGLGKKVHVL